MLTNYKTCGAFDLRLQTSQKPYCIGLYFVCISLVFLEAKSIHFPSVTPSLSQQTVGSHPRGGCRSNRISIVCIWAPLSDKIVSLELTVSRKSPCSYRRWPISSWYAFIVRPAGEYCIRPDCRAHHTPTRRPRAQRRGYSRPVYYTRRKCSGLWAHG